MFGYKLVHVYNAWGEGDLLVRLLKQYIFVTEIENFRLPLLVNKDITKRQTVFFLFFVKCFQNCKLNYGRRGG